MSTRQPATRSSDGAGVAVAGVAVDVGVAERAANNVEPIADGDADGWAMRGTAEPQPATSRTRTKVLPNRTNLATVNQPRRRYRR